MTKHLYYALALVGLTFCSLPAQAQLAVANYSFIDTDTAYTVQTPDSLLFDGATAAFSNDDGTFDNIPLGFSFPYLGRPYDNVYIAVNGCIGFDAGSFNGGIRDFSNSGGALFKNSGNKDAIAFLNADQYAPIDPNGAFIGIKRGIQNGQHYFLMTWEHMHRYSAGSAAGDDINLQVYLWESGRVNIIYGASTIGSSVDRLEQVGLLGDTITDFIAIGNDWPGPLASSSDNTTSLPLTASDVWTDGRMFSFFPPEPTANDLKASVLVLPGINNPLCGGSATQQIQLRITNLGSTAVTSVPAGYRLNGGAAVTQTITLPTPLNTYQSTVITLTDANGVDLSANGTYNVCAFVSLPGDAVTLNDSACYSQALGADLLLPSTRVFDSYDSLTTHGWHRAQGRGGRQAYTNFNIEQETIGTNDVLAVYYSDFTAIPYSWVIRDGIRNTSSGTKAVAFKLAVGQISFGSPTMNPVSSIGNDDTLKVRVSTDCGTTWSTLRSFTQSDVANRDLSNNLNTFIVPILGVNPGQTFSIGFDFIAGNNAAPDYYYFVLDSVVFGGDPDVRAVAVQGVRPFLGYCFGDPQPITLSFTNTGFVAIDSVTLSYTANNGAPVTQQYVNHLNPGESDTVTFNTPFLPTTYGPQNITVTATTPGDILIGNNTTTFVTQVGAAQPLPSTAYTGFNNLAANGFLTGTGPGGALAGGFYNSTDYGSATPTAAVTVSPLATVSQSWLISPSLYGQVSSPVNVQFKLAVTSGATGNFPNADVGADDSLNVYYRVHCGAWQLVYAYTAAFIQSHAITNQLRFQEIDFPGIAVTDTFQLAFVATDAGTRPNHYYRWHINGLRVADVVATRPALQALGLSLAPNPASGSAYISGLKGEATATLQDLQGRALSIATLTATDNRLDLRGIAAGTYLVQVETASGRATQRLVIE